MSLRLQLMLRYMLARAQESSTWRGLAMLCSVSGAYFKPEWTELMVLLGMGTAGVIGAAFPDKPTPPPEPPPQ